MHFRLSVKDGVSAKSNRCPINLTLTVLYDGRPRYSISAQELLGEYFVPTLNGEASHDTVKHPHAVQWNLITAVCWIKSPVAKGSSETTQNRRCNLNPPSRILEELFKLCLFLYIFFFFLGHDCHITIALCSYIRKMTGKDNESGQNNKQITERCSSNRGKKGWIKAYVYV